LKPWKGHESFNRPVKRLEGVFVRGLRGLRGGGKGKKSGSKLQEGGRRDFQVEPEGGKYWKGRKA